MANPEAPNKERKQDTIPFGVGLIDDAIIVAFLASAALARAGGRSLTKIIGNAPGRMGSWVEDFLRSDFRAGKSYYPIENKSDQTLYGQIRVQDKLKDIPSPLGNKTNVASVISRDVVDRSSDLKKMFLNFNRKKILSAAIVGSMFLGGRVEAHNLVPVGKNVSVVQASKALRQLTDYTSGLYEKGSTKVKNASDILYETAIHESQLLKHRRQVVRDGRKLVERGVARSIWMVEPRTAKDIVFWASKHPRAMNLLTTSSGLTSKELTRMSRDQLAQYLVQHDHLAASIALLKYDLAPGDIPSTKEARAAYWSKYYQGKSNPVKEQKYLSDNRLMAEEVKAASLSGVMKRHIKPSQPTQGLVNKVLHESKVQHSISSSVKKLSSLYRFMGRR